jgi:hypothetical protein
LKLKYDEMLSNFAFNFNLRRYMMAALLPCLGALGGMIVPMAGAYTPPLFSST